MTRPFKPGWFLCAAVGLFLSLLIIELAARGLAYYHRTAMRRDFPSRILEKFPQRDIMLADRKDMGRKCGDGLKYYDYYLYDQNRAQEEL